MYVYIYIYISAETSLHARVTDSLDLVARADTVRVLNLKNKKEIRRRARVRFPYSPV